LLVLPSRAILFDHPPLIRMNSITGIRACYLHARLRHVNRDFTTNTTLRKRFGIDPKNSAIASRLINEVVEIS